MDTFLEFYYFHGRFPGENRLIVLPYFDLPEEINNSRIDFFILFQNFRETYFQPLVSIQGLCALAKYITFEEDDKNLDNLIKKTLEKFFNNLLEQNLNIYNVGEISYENIIELMNLVVDNLNYLNREINNRRDTVNENIRSRTSRGH